MLSDGWGSSDRFTKESSRGPVRRLHAYLMLGLPHQPNRFMPEQVERQTHIQPFRLPINR